MSRYNITSTVFLVLFLASLGVDGIFSIPLWWFVLLVGIFLSIVAYGASVLSASFFVTVKSSGNNNGVALSFDDGPFPGKTEKILDILKAHNIPAAFFCVGHRALSNPDILKRIDEEGHLVGNHTYYHGKLFDLKSSPMVIKELFDTDIVIHNTIGKRPKFFRPPYGVTNPMIAKAVKRGNYTVVGWSIRSLDTVISDPEKLLRRITAKIKSGDIILLHDYPDSTIQILPRLLAHIKTSGLNVVRIDRLLNEKAYA